MLTETILPLVARWVHILAAVTTVGGMLFMRFVLMPAASEALTEEQHVALREKVMDRWRILVTLSIVLLLVTGCRENVHARQLTNLQAEQLKFAKTRPFGVDKEGKAYVNGVTELTRLTQEGQPVKTLLFDEAHPTMTYSRILADALLAKIAPWIASR